jgi:lysophospholipase L1-like esterase
LAGRPSSQGVPVAADAAEQGADVVLVELGTNDSAAAEFRGHLVETLDLLRDVPLVLWQTARGPEELTTIAQVNEAIREVVPRYPNAAVVDWEAFVPVEELMDDGIHPQDGSEGLESELLTPILETWRGAVSGEGATSCGMRVVRASS